MTNQPPPAKRLQQRLLARLIAAIYGITEALIPIVQAVATKRYRPWKESARFEARFWTIIRELLILTTRVQPRILSPNPSFPPLRPKSAQPATTEQTRTTPVRKARSRTPPPITPRQLAKRLAQLLYQLRCLASEAGAALTAPYFRHATRARAIAGCDALPPVPYRCWESTS